MKRFGIAALAVLALLFGAVSNALADMLAGARADEAKSAGR